MPFHLSQPLQLPLQASTQVVQSSMLLKLRRQLALIRLPSQSPRRMRPSLLSTYPPLPPSASSRSKTLPVFMEAQDLSNPILQAPPQAFTVVPVPLSLILPVQPRHWSPVSSGLRLAAMGIMSLGSIIQVLSSHLVQRLVLDSLLLSPELYFELLMRGRD